MRTRVAARELQQAPGGNSAAMVHLKEMDGMENARGREQKPVLYAHLRISVSGREKNHKPTREERVRHHPKKMFPTVPMGIRYMATGQRNRSLI